MPSYLPVGQSVLTWVTPETWLQLQDTCSWMILKKGEELPVPTLTFSNQLPDYYLNFRVPLGAGFSSAADFPEVLDPNRSPFSNFFPAVAQWYSPPS